MAINFPVPTTVGQIYTDSVSGSVFVCTAVGPPATWVGSGSTTNLNAEYLRLDTSNDPLGGDLAVGGTAVDPNLSLNIDGSLVSESSTFSDVYRKSPTLTDNIVRWFSDVGGTRTRVGQINANGDVRIGGDPASGNSNTEIRNIVDGGTSRNYGRIDVDGKNVGDVPAFTVFNSLDTDPTTTNKVRITTEGSIKLGGTNNDPDISFWPNGLPGTTAVQAVIGNAGIGDGFVRAGGMGRNTANVDCGVNFVNFGGSATKQVAPCNSANQNIDNLVGLGGPSARFTVLYAATGTINTSDENAKEEIEALSAEELRVASALSKIVKKFKFKDAVTRKAKSTSSARIHVGVIAQQVEAAFTEEGLDAHDYALFCEDTAEDGTVTLGIRYEELNAFLTAALAARLETLEARIETLEGA